MEKESHWGPTEVDLVVLVVVVVVVEVVAVVVVVVVVVVCMYVCMYVQYVLLITRPVIIEYAYNEGNLWVPNAPVLYITKQKIGYKRNRFLENLHIKNYVSGPKPYVVSDIKNSWKNLQRAITHIQKRQ